jgi:hypothetical protein
MASFSVRFFLALQLAISLCVGGLGTHGQVMGIQELDPDEAFVMAPAGGQHLAAITSSGRAVCWGVDEDGLVSGIPALDPDKAPGMVSAGGYHSAAITWSRCLLGC